MPSNSKSTPDKSIKKGKTGSHREEVEAVLALLRSLATKATLDGMARYGLPSDKALGVSVGAMQKLAKRLGRNHELAAALWDTGWYEARMLVLFIDEPARVRSRADSRICRSVMVNVTSTCGVPRGADGMPTI